MDYNYVRMRNAKKAGDDALEMHYRRLLEKGMKSAEETRGLDRAVILLLAAAVILGAYILFVI